MGDLTLPTIHPPMAQAYIEIDPFWRREHPDGWKGKKITMERDETGWLKEIKAEATYRLPFHFIDLEDGLEESAAVNYADNEVIGRAESYKTYMGTANREIPLTFRFQAQGLQESALDELTMVLRREVVGPALWLEGLKYPWTGDDGLSHAPPRCFLRIGDLFSGTVIATDVQLQWQPPFDAASMLPYGATVPCTFTVVKRVIADFDFMWDKR